MTVYCDASNCIYNNGKGICEAGGKIELAGVGRAGRKKVFICMTFMEKRLLK